MAKRLYMTNADYLAIAISPALIMTLVGSLVFFLIEVLYVGQYEVRLNYAFALFVFAAVLIARISIEMGSERAAMFALPLGIVMFLFMLRFIQHPSPLSHLINLALLAVVWWCAHKLTWDSTVIDDDEDASGQGLMQRIGVDEPDHKEPAKQGAAPAAAEVVDNELFDGDASNAMRKVRWWSRLFQPRSGPHSPGLWVLYFSLAALPLFGIGQHWIPAADVGRRRYVFFLLLVYVASALSLLVSTSFLNLRRYLRQRRVEMPAPIAGTWVGVGAVLIAVVMLLAMLIPRPSAEIALSRPPWQAGSPQDHSASRMSVIRDGGEQDDTQQAATGEAIGDEGTPAEDQQSGESSERSGEHGAATSDSGSSTSEHSSESSSASKSTEGNQAGDNAEAPSNENPTGGQQSAEATKTQSPAIEQSRGEQQAAGEGQPPNDAALKQDESHSEDHAGDREQAASNAQPPDLQAAHPPDMLQNLATLTGGVSGLLKILFYALIALLLAYFTWKYRRELIQALADIWRQLRGLLTGSGNKAAADAAQAQPSGPLPPKFSDFRDPFQSGRHGQLAPEELVRYTFAAFEAWSSDRGRPRSPDCTPQELLIAAVEPATPMYTEARQLVRLYYEVAYASRQVPRETANNLGELWRMMRTSSARGVAASQTP